MAKKSDQKADIGGSSGLDPGEGVHRSRYESAQYIAEMLASLRQMADKEDMPFLVHLLDMARLEATNESEAIAHNQKFLKN